MGGHTSKLTVENITDTIVETVIKSTQSSMLITKQIQSINIDTTKYNENLGKLRNECIKTKSTDECIKLHPQLKVEDIKVSNCIDLNSSVTQIANLTAKQQSEIENKIKNELVQKNDGFSIGNDAESAVSNVVKTQLKSIIDVLQQATQSITAENYVVITGAGVRGITMESITNITSQTLMDNTSFNENMNKIKNDIDASVKQQTGFGLLTKILIGFIMFFVVIYLLMLLFKKKGKIDKSLESSK